MEPPETLAASDQVFSFLQFSLSELPLHHQIFLHSLDTFFGLSTSPSSPSSPFAKSSKFSARQTTNVRPFPCIESHDIPPREVGELWQHDYIDDQRRLREHRLEVNHLPRSRCDPGQRICRLWYNTKTRDSVHQAAKGPIHIGRSAVSLMAYTAICRYLGAECWTNKKNFSFLTDTRPPRPRRVSFGPASTSSTALENSSPPQVVLITSFQI